MKTNDIANIRLVNQQIAKTKFKTPKELVSWMGAMQAQDFIMAKLAVGVRLPGSKETLIEEAIKKGEILRTHVLRPTWHFVSSEDIRWMLELTAPHIKSGIRSRHKHLGLTEAAIKKSNRIIEKALSGGKHLTREEIMSEFKKAKVDVSENRSSHFLMMAELDGLICSGKIKNRKQSYALLEDRVPKTKSLKREEALAYLAERYFISHGPATLSDFVWWSGLPVSDARKAIEMVKASFVSEMINDREYWFTDSNNLSKKFSESVHLLPAYDEFLISYRDRNASLSLVDNKKAVSNNGIFRPVILINGQVKGIWKRTIKNSKVIVEINFFKPQKKVAQQKVKKAAMKISLFLNKKVEVIFNPV